MYNQKLSRRAVRFLISILLSSLVASISTAQDLSFGAVLSLSGFGAIGGEDERRGLEMAREEINSKGGIANKKVNIIYEDNRSSTRETVSAFTKLAASDKVPVIFGPNWVEFAEVAAPLAQRYRTIMISASAYSETLTKDRPFVFTVRPPLTEDVNEMVEYIRASKITRIAVFHTATGYFDQLMGATLSKLHALRLKPLREFIFNPQTTDFRAALAAVTKSKVEAIIVYLQEGDLSIFLRQLRELHFRGAVFSADLTYYPDIMEDKSKADGVIFIRYITNAQGRMVEKYRTLYGADPSYAAVHAYDNLLIVKAAVEKCGLEIVALRECITDTHYQGVSGLTTFSKDRVINSVSKMTDLMLVKGKEFAPLLDVD